MLLAFSELQLLVTSTYLLLPAVVFTSLTLRPVLSISEFPTPPSSA